MNRDIEARIAEELRSMAEGAGSTGSMAEAARRRARRIRVRRRVTAAGVAVTMAAVAVPVGLALSGIGDAQTMPEPAGTVSEQSTPTPTQTPAPSPEPSDPPTTGPEEPPATVVTISLDDLPAGDPPSIDWTDGQTLRTADGREVPIPDDIFGARSFGDAVIGCYFTESGSGTLVQAADGSVSRYPGSCPTVSEDGQLASWYVEDGDEIEFARSDGEAGPGPIAGGEDVALQPVGFLDDQTVVSNLMGTEWPPAGVRMDRAGEEPGVPWPSLLQADAASRQAQLVVGLTEVRGDFEFETSVFPADSAEPLWSTWEYDFERFSPDGRLLLGTHAYRDGAGDSFAVIVDARTGDLIRHFDLAMDDDLSGYLSAMVFEDDGHILLIANVERAAGVESVIVRCSVDGVCETATEARLIPLEEWPQGRYDLPL